MCGIAGSVRFGSNAASACDYAAIEAMTESLRHRGPDSGGIVETGPAVLGHRRLAVIDVDHRADQPMVCRERDLVLVFNGEIYNFKDIRADLEGEGVRFRTESDTEVLLEGLARWGTAVLARCNGMFAFALWDGRNRKLLLGRDRLGKKPLHYFMTGELVVFASDLGSLALHPEGPTEVDATALGQYLAFNYVVGTRSIIAKISKPPPASVLTFAEGKPPEVQCYWDLAAHFRAKSWTGNFDEAQEHLLFLIDDAVRLRLISDVPVGAFLSGGIDSASIVAAMARNRDPASIKAFTIAFPQKGYCEADAARETALALHVDHHERTIAPDMALALPEIVARMAEPCADTSLAPFYYLCQHAREQVTVSLSGDGGDELFAGYQTYAADALARMIRVLPGPALDMMRWCSHHLLPTTSGKVSFDYKARQFLDGCRMPAREAHSFWRIIFAEQERLSLVRPDRRAALAAVSPLEDVLAHYHAVNDCDFVDQASYVDIKTWLVDSVLCKVDRMSMAHSLEVRAPLLDHRIVEFAASIPPEWKIKGLKGKRLLKAAQRRRLPAAIFNRPKLGFNAPLAHWIAGPLLERGRAATLSPAMLEWFERKRIEALWDEHLSRKRDNGYRLFGLIVLGLWFESRPMAYNQGYRPEPHLGLCPKPPFF